MKIAHFFCLFCALYSTLFSVELTKSDAETFFDRQINSQLQEFNIAGAVVSVVKEGEVLFSKGYGYADVEKKIEASSHTLFRPGSISKLFVWTAVMQQIEKGKLELDRDVNDYLDFKIPATFEKPITLRHLMTHRAGFEETIKDLFVKTPEDIHSLSHYLRTHLPVRIYEPGVLPAYSNYGAALAAYIVERVSNENFTEYVENHITKPLGMDHSTFRQPLPESFQEAMSKGYIAANESPRPFELIQAFPVGALTTTADDISRFMIMHLQKGKFNNVQMLKPDTATQMHARQEGWPEAINAMCLGFYEQSQNGYRVIGHEGHTILFHSKVFLNLDANTGLFISYNSAGLSKLDPCATLVDKFMDRYFPDISTQEIENEFQNAQNVVGNYNLSRRSETTLLAISKLFLETDVTANLEDNTISITALKGSFQQPLRFREIAPMVFQEVGGKAKIAFSQDANGSRIAHVNYDTNYPSTVYQENHESLINRSAFNAYLLGGSLVVIMTTIMGWLFSFGRINLTRFVCLIIVTYCINLAMFASTLDDLSMLSNRSDLWIRSIQILGLVITLGTLVLMYEAIKIKKVWNTLQTLACMGFVWIIYYWNLMSFHLNY